MRHSSLRSKVTSALLIGFALCAGSFMHGATTISPANHFAYGANLGWIEARGDANQGAIIGEYVCSGFLYAANVGWIRLGSGAPANGIRYQNNSAADFGVNHDGLGNLRGFAYGANIGWVNFESNGAPRVDLQTGKLTGSAYAANCGWISLSNASAFVQTATIAAAADSDGDGLGDGWERLKFGNLTSAHATSDADHDGASDRDEYIADTNPNDANSKLAILAFTTPSGGTSPTLVWNSALTRQYRIQKSSRLASPLWFDCGLGLVPPDGPRTTRTFADTDAPIRFYRVQAVKPLSP